MHHSVFKVLKLVKNCQKLERLLTKNGKTRNTKTDGVMNKTKSIELKAFFKDRTLFRASVVSGLPAGHTVLEETSFCL